MTGGWPSLRRSRPIVTVTVLVNGVGLFVPHLLQQVLRRQVRRAGPQQRLQHAELLDREVDLPLSLPDISVPTMAIWSARDHYLDGERVKQSAAYVTGPWRYEEIPDASHWIPLDAPDRLNALLADWLG